MADQELVIELMEAEIVRLRAVDLRARKVEREMGMALSTIRDYLTRMGDRPVDVDAARGRALLALEYLGDA